FINGAQATENVYGLCRAGLIQGDRLKATTEGRSFSKYFLYSRQVVAAIVRSSPRASAGLSRLAASEPPSLLPAPINVWASSINRMMGVAEALTASITPLRRF